MSQKSTSQKRALITGVTGQDGSYLAELLLEKGYEVHGIVRRASTFNRGRIDHLTGSIIPEAKKETAKSLHLHYGDMLDSASLLRVLNKVQPDEVYNLAAQSHVQVSFEVPIYTGESTGLGSLKLFDAVREVNPQIKIYQAGSSEMYGRVAEIPQSERTPFYPRSPYGCAKVYAHWTAINYREAYNMFICNGILFNHESPRRGENFVTRKISQGVAAIKLGLQKELRLGNLEAKRDWGFAGDYVVAMWKMLQQKQADDYVVSTGETHSVREFCEIAFSHAGLNYKDYVVVDEKYFRPTEVDILIGDCSKAKKELDWNHKVGFQELVRMMVDADIKQMQAKYKNF